MRVALRTRFVMTAIAVAVAAGTLVTAAGLTVPARNADPLGAAIPVFHVRGHVRSMYPGRVVMLRARIDNPYGFAIVVRFVRAKVLNATTTCTAHNLRIRKWRGAITVPPHSYRAVLLAAAMRITAPPACQGVRFPIVFAGRAVRA